MTAYPKDVVAQIIFSFSVDPNGNLVACSLNSTASVFILLPVSTCCFRLLLYTVNITRVYVDSIQIVRYVFVCYLM